ncbi:MAG: amidohydrolase family protein [Armatimonadetes bacterium]|nr:amidohydrolase family protein [Armatimonadota bacterium]
MGTGVTLRPYGLVADGRLELGLEVVLGEGGAVSEIRPHTGVPDQYVLAPAFVNAHSHFEYRGLQGAVHESGYFAWIKALTKLKRAQSSAQVRQDCQLAAAENRACGVAFVAEHSDRPFSGEAMATQSLDGAIFQEVITFAESADPAEKLERVAESMRKNAQHFHGDIAMAPHAPWTVDTETLKALAESGERLSIHVAESVHENAYFKEARGPIADACAEVGIEHPHGARTVAFLADLGYLRQGVQFVHACDVDPDEVALIASAGVSVAHCPRSNEALDCPRAPVREMLDAGVLVGLGLDSAASAGPIDMFAEMAAALRVSEGLGRPITPEEAWRAATTMGAECLGRSNWDVAVGSSAPLIKIHVQDAQHVEDLIVQGSPESIEWVTSEIRN